MKKIVQFSFHHKEEDRKVKFAVYYREEFLPLERLKREASNE
jgi:hypothetical protein